ncbi:hypothetical protein AB0M02_21920 [Actinoplanes sp. NPDC051861]|uniref:hypothetical protein n=1 Tax=Actinoplanes sp. NPDC051861 TaxID=3155170 RepID=UPI00342ACEE3
MPHLTVHAAETDLTGHEDALITALTDAVTTVYGDWARPIAVVRLVGVPTGRWGIGGEATTNPAPTVAFGIKAQALEHPDILKRLAGGVTDAIGGILGHHDQITVDFIPTQPGTTAVGGTLTD